MRNISRSAIAGGLALILAGCGTTRVANTDRTSTPTARTDSTKALTFDTLTLGGKDYISSQIPAGYTAKVEGKILPRGNVLLYLTPADNPTINNSTYSPDTNAFFAANTVYTNGTLALNDSESLATTKFIVYSGKAPTKTESTGEFSSRTTIQKREYPQKTVRIGNHTLRIGENTSAPKYILFMPKGQPTQRIRDGKLDVVQETISYGLYSGEIVEAPKPITPEETNDLNQTLGKIPIITSTD
jgi:hypothetical protein